jgi:hypothetical protein
MIGMSFQFSWRITSIKWFQVIDNRKKLIWLFLFLIVFISFIVKFVALNKYEAPPSPDYGNYLTQVNILNGLDVGGNGLRYNPIYFLFLDLFLRFFEPFTALKILSALVFSIAAIPFYFLAKKFSNSDLAAVVSSIFFIFFELYSEMIAWGGGPNFLGFSFMLLTIFFLLEAFQVRSIKNYVLTGICLSLVVGTHFLVAAFTIFLVIFFVFFSILFSKNSRKSILKVSLLCLFVSILLSLPYAQLYLNFLGNSSSGLVTLNFSQLYNAFFGVTSVFTTTFFVILIIASLGLFGLAKYFKTNKTNALFLACLFLAPLILALFTDQPNRWFYFLPIPLFISFGLFLKYLFESIKGARKEIIIVAFSLILLIGVQTTVSSLNRLSVSMDYYQSVGVDEIEAFNWIKQNTLPNAVFATSGPNKIIGTDSSPGSSYSWWVEGLSQRKCLHTGLPTWYTYQDERSETLMLNGIFEGAYNFEFHGLRLSDNFPYSLKNPEIAAFFKDHYQNLLFLNDAEQELVFSPTYDTNVNWVASFSEANNKTSTFQYDDSSGNMTFSSVMPNFKIERSIHVNSSQSAVDLYYNITSNDTIFKNCKIKFWASYYTNFQNFSVNDTSVTLEQKMLLSNELVASKIDLCETNGFLNESTVLAKDPKYSLPVVTFSINPAETNLSLHFKITINNQQVTNNDLKFYDTYKLLIDTHVNYILLNTNREDEFYRFTTDTQHFSKVFENPTVIILRVVDE